ncbi:MAG: hypothetical protein WKF66_09920 [Pedobacter sp.]
MIYDYLILLKLELLTRQKNGDPQKIGEVIIKMAQVSEPPLRLLLGSNALQFAGYKIQMLQEGIEANKEITLSTDFQ